MVENNTLSERELEILQLVATGASNKEIARDLHISVNTVKVHLRHTYEKMGVRSRTEATTYALKQGLIRLQTNQKSEDSAIATSPLIPWSTGRISLQWLLGMGIALVFIMSAILYLWTRLSISGSSAEIATPKPVAGQERWQQREDLKHARAGAAIAVVGNQIYVVGGLGRNGPINSVEKFDATTNSWIGLPPKPTAVTDARAAVLGGKIYVPGGCDLSGMPISDMEVYDPIGNVWARMQPLPTGVCRYALTVFEGRIILTGGWDGFEFVNSALSFNPATNSWTELTPMPSPRGGHGASAAGGSIFVFGGENETGLVVDTDAYTLAYEGQGNPWTRVGVLPEPLGSAEVVSIADVLYVFGNSENEELHQYQYYPMEDRWQMLEIPPAISAADFSITPMGGYIVLVGGRRDGRVLSQHYQYQAIYTLLIPVLR